MELLKSMAKIDLIHVPFKGAGPAMPALLTGQVSAMFASYGLAAQQIKASKLRVLAVSTAQRAVSVPEVPTIAEAGVPGYESNVWYALLAPHGTPRPIIARLSSEVAGLIKSSDLRRRILTDGIVPVGSTPEELGAYIKVESAKWATMVPVSRRLPLSARHSLFRTQSAPAPRRAGATAHSATRATAGGAG